MWYFSLITNALMYSLFVVWANVLKRVALGEEKVIPG
jgi:hypothetical protein